MVEDLRDCLLRIHNVVVDIENHLYLRNPLEHDVQISSAEEVSTSWHDEVKYVCVLFGLQSGLHPLRMLELYHSQTVRGLVALVVLQSRIRPEDEETDFPSFDKDGFVERRRFCQIPAHDNLGVGLDVTFRASH